MNTIRPDARDRGFNLLRVDLATGRAETFAHNRHPGPATEHGSGGMERPVDCKFHPDGRSLYVLDFGRHVATRSTVIGLCAHRGAVAHRPRPGSIAVSAAPAPAHPPVLIELDGAFWQGQLDRAEAFLGTVALLQAEFRAMAEDVAAKVGQPQFRRFLQGIAEDARRHEAQLDEFSRMIGREPAHGRGLVGTLAAKGRELLAGVEGAVSGASSPWRDLRQLWMSSHGAEGAFGVVEQLGYALGHKEFAELAFKLANEKHRVTLLVQEIVLEMAAVAVLCDGPTDAAFGPRTGAEGPFLPDGG